MNTTILEKIVQSKIEWIKKRKKKQPLNSIKHSIYTSNHSFKKTLISQKPFLILEIKKSSPSLGKIVNNFDIYTISRIYKKYATCVSVLTDEVFFSGKFEYIPIVKSIVNKPILCKDFFIDTYQVYLSRFYQADAILLMLSILNDQQFLLLYQLAKQLNMNVITEINNVDELNRAIKLKSEIIGINNRNLHDLNIDINRTIKLAPLIPNNIIKISESGIKNYATLNKLKKIVDGFLIGSFIMKHKDHKEGIHKIIFGKNKICGITRVKDAYNSKKIGAIFGGMIFVKKSQRKINLQIAKNIIDTINLKYVAVFQNEKIEKIVKIATTLKLYAIQLHGNENQFYINALKEKIPYPLFIWKVISIHDTIPKFYFDNIQYFLYDNQNGGTGTSFNWSLLTKKIYTNSILSGGINANNCQYAAQLGFDGLDLNSGVEIEPGIKSKKKIKNVFELIKINKKNIF
ncbi:Tryptophan biosynthesis protein TrpCF [Buchnera aphidicola (Thelaxes suberi)]|uniref:bifunctional indole-3-glycerol-phosphate synthase TrpC/phosphoribosylanthranilate isomerase TrpF n=1 Tax=Buchnera aphidicola TaxID=9 RepID=UPI0034640281